MRCSLMKEMENMPMNDQGSGARRVWYLDLLRIFATMSVVLLHATPISQMELDVASAQWNVLNFISSMVRWACLCFS